MNCKMIHQSFATTTRGLRRDSPALRLYEKAKRFGIWNPSDLDFHQDLLDWQGFTEIERDVILRLVSMFQAGEEAVTLDLLPLIQVIAQEGRIEEEMYLTTFLFEEAKHTDFFRRFLDEVAGRPGDLGRYTTENYRNLIYDRLPEALQRLREDPSPAAQVEASVTYNLIIEGVLAETGYHAFFSMLERNDLMPGVRRGITLLKQDESRHIAYGIYLLSRLVAADASLWQVLENTMNTLLMPAVGVISDVFACYKTVPFGLVEEDFMNYAMDQFQKRYTRLERSREASLAEIEQATRQIIAEDDA
jgi:ribonucleoside-diphosphate reductase beta chain